MALEYWRALAACYGIKTELFYLERGESAALPEDHNRDTVEQVCILDCPVRVICLNENYNDLFGTWGGWRGENRSFVRRYGHPCPWCETDIRPNDTRLFCGDLCYESAATAGGEVALVIRARLEDMYVRAALINKLRKREPVSGEVDVALAG